MCSLSYPASSSPFCFPVFQSFFNHKGINCRVGSGNALNTSQEPSRSPSSPVLPSLGRSWWPSVVQPGWGPAPPDSTFPP